MSAVARHGCLPPQKMRRCGAKARLSEEAPLGWVCKKRAGHWFRHADGQVRWPKS